MKRIALLLPGALFVTLTLACPFLGEAATLSIASGQFQTGTISSGTSDAYTFTGNVGDNIVLRVGTTNFVPRIDLYAPGGAIVTNAFTANGNIRDAVLYFQLTNSGTFTATVSSYFAGGAGTYGVKFAQIPGSFVVPASEAGGTLKNGATYAAAIVLGGFNIWSFSGNAGDNIQLRMGATNFVPRIDLYGPNGAVLTNGFTVNGNIRDAWLALQLTNSGTFTVVVSSYFLDTFGGYSLNLAQVPESFIVSPGQQGGPLANGIRNNGQIGLGGLQMWAFSGNTGDSIQLRMGATNFVPRIDLYGPGGTLLTNAFTANGNIRDAWLPLRLTNSGTFTVVVSSYFLDDFGGYSLTLAQIPGTFTVSPGEQGGVLTNGFLQPGTINLGGLDMWTFSGNAGDNVELRMGTIAYSPQISFYGPDGALLTNAFTANGNIRDAAFDLQLTNTGTFTAVVSSGFLDSTGDYTLTLAHEPGQVFAAPGDEGGLLMDGFTIAGTNSMGDQDVWSFYGTVGDSNLFRIGSVNFTPYLRLYGPSGALVGEAFTANGNVRTNFLTYIVTNAGNYTLVSSAYFLNQSGTYSLKQSRVPPDLILPGTQTVNDEGATLNLPVSAQDPDDPAKSLTFLLVSAPTGMTLTTLGPTNASLSWTTTDADGPSTNLVVVTVTDVVLSKPFIRTNSFTVVVLEVNKPPVLPVVPIQTVNELTSLTVTNAATEPDLHSTTIGYGLLGAPTGATIDSSGVFRWTPSQTQSPSTNTIVTVVTNNNPYDAVNPQLTTTNSFQIVVKEVNMPPVLGVIPAQTINELVLLTVTNPVTEPNIHSTTLGYGLLSAPTGATIDASGVFRWTPSQTQSPSTNTIVIVVTNNNPYDALNPHLTATNSFQVVVKEVNVAPVLGVIPSQTINELVLLTVTNAATEPNIHSTTIGYGLLSAPTGVTIDSSGVLRWTPAQTQSPSTNTIVTVVTNNNPYDAVNARLTATNSFQVVVKEVNVAPVLPNIPNQTIDQLALLIVTNSASEPNIHAITAGYLLSAPPGAQLDANGVFTWTPTRAQAPSTNVITTVVTNTDLYDAVNPHLAATNSFTVIVRHTNSPPVLQPITDASVHYGTLLSVQAVASDPDTADILTYSLSLSPTNMSINPSNGLIKWTPTLAQFGSNSVTVQVTDNGQPPLSATATFHVLVLGQQPQLGIQPLAGHLVQLNILGDVGVTYEVQVSTNLESWSNLIPVTPTSSPFPYIDPASSALVKRFYRLKLGP